MDDINRKNTSGHGEFAEAPVEIKGWNWGAFWLGWIWGIGNKTYIALLGLIPIVNIVVKFYLGFKGNELAWSNKYWYSVEDFKDTQKKWAKWGWGIAIVVLILSCINFNNEYQALKLSESIKNEVMVALKDNDKIKDMLGNDYRILSEPSLMEVGNKAIGATMWILVSDEVLFVDIDLTEDRSIKKIKVSWGEDTAEESIEIYP